MEEELMFLDENIHEAAMQTSMTGTSANINEPTGNIYMPPTASSKSISPNHPILSEYPTKLRGNEPYPRRFNPQLYKKYPWITYEIEDDQCVYFSCREFENDYPFVFNNWWKPEKLSKHGISQKHVTSMTKWALYIAIQKQSSSVLNQINSAHKQEVISTRQ